MAITQAMSTLFKKDVLLGDHHLDSDNIYIALYTSSATLNATTDGYTTSNEVANGNGYTTGGNPLTSKAVTEDTNSASTTAGSGVFDAADPEWTSATFTARGALIYNKTLGDAADPANSRGAIAILDFGGDFSVSGGTFKIVFPAPDRNTAIVRID